jgi:uncharacterized protein (TIGR02246 family)
METGDLEALLGLLTDDVVLKTPSSPPRVGRGAVEEALRAFHADYEETVEYEVDEVEVSGDLAFIRISERATVRPKLGEESFSAEGMHLGILRRQENGRWLIARDVSSLNGE